MVFFFILFYNMIIIFINWFPEQMKRFMTYGDGEIDRGNRNRKLDEYN